jgi:hypothetical protein
MCEIANAVEPVQKMAASSSSCSMARFCSTTKAARQKYGAGLTQAGADLFALSMDRGRLGSGVTHTHPVAPLLPRGERAVTLRQALKKLRIPVLHLDNQPLCVDSASCGTGRPADSVIDSAPARLVKWNNVT